jgi:hypothetical protein
MKLKSTLLALLLPSALFAESKTFELNYVAADEAMRQCLATLAQLENTIAAIPNVLVVEKASVETTKLSIDRATNNLTVEGDAEKLKMATKNRKCRRPHDSLKDQRSSQVVLCRQGMAMRKAKRSSWCGRS